MKRIVVDEDLASFAHQHGYTFSHVMQCLVSHTDEGMPVLDQDCLDQPLPNGTASDQPGHARHGPGTELKALLAGWPFYIVSSPDCKCNARARYMDEKGCDWCESDEGMAEILGFLREAAEERGLPFLDVAARLLVKRAIHNARKAEAARAREADRPPLRPEQ